MLYPNKYQSARIDIEEAKEKLIMVFKSINLMIIPFPKVAILTNKICYILDRISKEIKKDSYKNKKSIADESDKTLEFDEKKRMGYK